MAIYPEGRAQEVSRRLAVKRRVIDVAAGRAKADLVLKNSTYVNVFSNELCRGDIAIAEGLFVGMADHY